MSIYATNEEFVKKLKERNPDIVPLEPYAGSKTKIKLRCLKDGYEWYATPSDLLRNDGVKHGCPVCANRVCFTGYNDAATRRPDLLKYFVDKEEAKHVTEGSHKKIKVKCTDCGHIKTQAVKDLCTKGFSCNKCGDGVSFPNKFIRMVIANLGIEAQYEYSPEWAQGKFYDVYFSYNGKEYVVQMDGGFHYVDNPMNENLTLEKVQAIDHLKDEMAFEHGIIMIRIDSRESTVDYLRKHIEESLLGNIFDLSKVNWNVCAEEATKNIVKTACEFYEKHYADLHLYEIADAVGVGRSTMWSYINKGEKFGWCKRHKPLKTLAPRKTTDEKSKEICRYYEEHYQTQTKVEVAKHFGIGYSTFEICFKKGIENGWCVEHPTLTRHQGIEESKKKEICEYYEKYYARYPKYEIAKHFNISNNALTRIIKFGIERGWCNKHPRVSRNKANRK